MFPFWLLPGKRGFECAISFLERGFWKQYAELAEHRLMWPLILAEWQALKYNEAVMDKVSSLGPFEAETGRCQLPNYFAVCFEN
jgi:hypothetical protein